MYCSEQVVFSRELLAIHLALKARIFRFWVGASPANGISSCAVCRRGFSCGDVFSPVCYEGQYLVTCRVKFSYVDERGQEHWGWRTFGASRRCHRQCISTCSRRLLKEIDKVLFRE